MRAISTARGFKTGFAALLGSSMLASPAFAQQSAPPPSQPPAQSAGTNVDLGEIIVTAQKRAENLQNVPISIQALGTEKLTQLDVSNFNDFTKQLPSVTFQSSQPGFTTVYVRGVASGGDGNHSGSLPSVGFYLDEQPITTIGGTLDVHIYDIARIEALSGPQGTLYGASSEAGTIRIITNRPTTAGFEGAIDGEFNSVDHGGQGGKVEGYLNVPFNDRIALRVVGFYQHDAGFIDNIPGTRTFIKGLNPDGSVNPNGITINNSALVKKDFNDVDTAGGRAALKIDLNDDWTATASLFGQDQHAHGSFGYDPSLGDLKVQHFFPDLNHDRWLQAALTIEGKIGSWDLTYAGAYLKRKRNTQNDYVDYAEAYDALYASYGGLAGYFYYQDNAGNTIAPTQHIVASDNFNKLSQELRISSPAENPFRIVGGLFYQRQSNDIHQDYQVPNLGDIVSVNGHPGTLWLTQQKRVDRDYAIFGEASYDFTPRLTLTGGLRGYRYDNSLIGFFGFGRNPGVDPADGQPYTALPHNAAGSSRTGVAGCYTTTGLTLRDALAAGADTTLLPAAVPGSPCTDLGTFVNGHIVPKRTKNDGITWRVNLTWKPADGKLLYFTWSRGFRPGGINRRATIPPYKEDTLTNYEVGFKTSWGGNFRLNGALFWQDWNRFQFSFLGENSFTEIHNGPDARIKGVEADFAWTPVEGLTLSGNGAYIDAKTLRNLCGYDDPTFACTALGPQGQTNFISAPKGTRLPVTPRFKFSGTARYEFPVTTDMQAHLQAVVTHQSSASSDIRTLIFDSLGNSYNPAALTGRLAPWTTADFAVGADWKHYNLELFIQNAFDERAQLSRYQECGLCFQRPYIVPNTPRTIGIRAGYKF